MAAREGVGAELDWSCQASRYDGLAEKDFFRDSIPTGTDLIDRRRVLRGGSWNNKPENLRSANRNRNNPDNRNNNIGFRLAHYPPAKPLRAVWFTD